MKTDIHQMYKSLPEIDEAEKILRSCVHCGFCNATCPTYQQLFDERDGPRGRIYLVKQLLEGQEVTERTRTHFDRCLTCRSCETSCPSGVQYGSLIDIGREVLEKKLPRSMRARFVRWVLRQILPYKNRFGLLLKIGQLFKPVMPAKISRIVPEKQESISFLPETKHERVMLALEGCVQSSATPNTHAATAKILDRLGISLVSETSAACCGAISYHLNAQAEGLAFFKRNIDAWWPAIEQGVEAIVITASGCGAMVKEYVDLLKHDAEYAEKARRVSEMAKDISEIIAAEDLTKLNCKPKKDTLAFHCPCTLQHAQQLSGEVENILLRLGFDLANTIDPHLCCGSAGTYSIFQAEMSQKLLDNKLAALSVENPSAIATANVGCQLHLASKSKIPVHHWIELVEQSIVN